VQGVVVIARLKHGIKDERWVTHALDMRPTYEMPHCVVSRTAAIRLFSLHLTSPFLLLFTPMLSTCLRPRSSWLAYTRVGGTHLQVPLKSNTALVQQKQSGREGQQDSSSNSNKPGAIAIPGTAESSSLTVFTAGQSHMTDHMSFGGCVTSLT
jgi:hypothetical protein